ncbi:MAG: protein translocase subunit SecF [Alphaproteobacteria bacterium]|jgi:preprotein translocase SecF subunit|nr:protein translocase subunit SecF [Alphaproteobacteria bacterium]MDP6237299.1 protein translocase subunit SecF [Alphaproteobacteria bacterium]MDP7172755.1 protein translocase subunit SecF [Alphaproteobacteria bacterium]MDP7234491.1 protein translocase subunit SecF [Alphaproteobacteria bacterium]MDP7488803.1 protein translocase subunit SecF [Alphaproteobacteria bacterium]|tara:strand:- start:11210 stop:12199 length:990 start_codon:yes stop_codon:yes gene_type:complete
MRLPFIPEKPAYPFMSWRKGGFAFSAVLMVASVLCYFVFGLNYGIDFRGGIVLDIGTQEKADVAAFRDHFSSLDLGEVRIQLIEDIAESEEESGKNVLIRVERQPGGDAAQQEAIVRIKGTLASYYGETLDYRRTEAVGPTVGAELKTAGVQAVVFALLAMLVYIWFRFEWQFSIGAVAALAHDVMATIGLFAVTQLEFNLATVAAILLIVGYSMNDTVVVYDRVRENLRKYKKMELIDLLSRSINDTLSRTLMTSITTLLALLALWVFGGPVIRDFCFAMIWGVLIGTYSSIFIAAPLLIQFGLESLGRRARVVSAPHQPQEVPPADG